MANNVIARLTVTRANGWNTIVEVRVDASFHNFYRFYRQQGAKRSTKELIRTASRNEGLPLINSLAHKPGLELIQQRLEAYGAPSNPVVNVRIRIIRKRAYRKLISARPDELGMARTRVNIPVGRFSPLRIPVQMPSTFAVKEQAS